MFTLAGCSWDDVNSQLLFGWTATTKTVGQYDRKSIWGLGKEVEGELMMANALSSGCGQVKHFHLE